MLWNFKVVLNILSPIKSLYTTNRILFPKGCLIKSEVGEEVGHITSGTFSPNLNRPIAMGYLKSEILEDVKSGTLRIFSDVRGKMTPTTLTKLPFIKTKYFKTISSA